MNYTKIYRTLIQKAKSQVRKKNINGEYFEEHHIIPEFMFKNRTRKGPKGHLDGNPDDRSNLVLLTAREHFVAHLLLYKIYNGKRYGAQCGTAIWLFFRNGSDIRADIVNSRKYQFFKEIGRRAISESKRGKIVAVDSVTREMIGTVDKNHPNVLSGKWMHHSTGKHMFINAITGERKYGLVSELGGNPDWNAVSTSGKGSDNNNYSGITNEEIFDEFLLLCNKLGFIPSYKFVKRVYFEKYGKTLPTLNRYRFNGGKELYPKLTEITGFQHSRYQKRCRSLNPRDYI